VPVLDDDTPDTLAARVLEREHAFLVETLARIVAGELSLD
jgi:phosphoribosylglycinamide formyltransferase-1